MKRQAYVLLMILLLAACSPVSARPSPQAGEATLQTEQNRADTAPGTRAAATPGPTELFITQVMATKYAARTQYAALPTVTLTPTIPPGSPDCSPSDLKTTFNTNGAGQHIVLEVGVQNISDRPCFIPSWPIVQVLDRAGKPLDISYEYITLNGQPSSLPPTQVSNPGEPMMYGLDTGQTAALTLPWGNWCQGAVTGGVVIHISLPASGQWLDIATDIEGGGYCNDPTSPSTLEVIGFGY